MTKTHHLLLFFAVALVLLAIGCVRVEKSIYQRFELPKNLDPQTEQQVVRGVAEAMRSQLFVDELRRKFPTVTQNQLLKTDIRWDVVSGTDGTRAFFISFGVKDTTDFPEAERIVDFFLEYGSNQARLLVEKAKKQKKTI